MKILDRQTKQEFEAEITTDHPSSIPGPLALRRIDNGDFISMRDIFHLPNRRYDLLEASPAERKRFEDNDIIIF